MTVTDFSVLSVSEQLELLFTEGVYLSKRRLGKSIVLLYECDQLYVEIFYRKYRVEVEQVTCSDLLEVVEPYLEQIDIQNILRHEGDTDTD